MQNTLLDFLDPPPSDPKLPPLDVSTIQRPDPMLLTYYLVVSICTGPGAFFALPYLWFRYLTLKYRFDDEGIAMQWGILFRKEVLLTYRRIQDIHLTRNLFQRWLGLADVSVQTASGSATPEMKIEGVLQAEALRDYLYKRMRGARHESSHAAEPVLDGSADATELLRDIRDNLATLVGRQEGKA